MTRPHPPNTFGVFLILKQYISHFYFLVSIFNVLFKWICLIVKEIIKKHHTVGTVSKCKKYEHVLAFKTNMLRNDTITNSKERNNVLYA
jgi:hypothetical protein